MNDMKNQIEEKVWELFDKHNIATHEDEGGVPCADEIAQYCAEQMQKVVKEGAMKILDDIEGQTKYFGLDVVIARLKKKYTEEQE